MLSKKTIFASALLSVFIGVNAANAAWHNLGWGTLATGYSGTLDLYEQRSRDTRTDGHCVYAVSFSEWDGRYIYHPWSCYSTSHSSRYVAGSASKAKLCRTGGNVCGSYRWH